MKTLKFITVLFICSSAAFACKFDDCENHCESKYIDGGVPLWSCAETCAVCKA